MPGYIYYIAVSVIGLALAVYVIYKKKNYAKLITFYLFATLVADCGEVLVMLLLNSYTYKLGVFADPIANDVLGHLLPNSTLWPAVAIFIAAYKPRLRWIVTIAFGFFVLDIIFIQLGVYKHNWWQSWMSGAAVFIYCVLMRFWYSKLEDSKILRFISFSSAYSLIMFLPAVTLLLIGNQFYSVGIFTDKYRDSVIFSFALHAALGPPGILFLCVLKRWYWKFMPLVIIFTCDLLLVAFGLLKFLNGWNVYCLMIIRIICLIIFIRLEKKYSYDIVKKA